MSEKHEPVTHAEVRQILMSDITHDDDCDIMHRYVNEQEAEITRLTRELEGCKTNGPHSREALMESLNKARDHEATLTRELAEARSQRDGLVGWLEKPDWCPECGGYNPFKATSETLCVGHKPNCSLKAALDAAKGGA